MTYLEKYLNLIIERGNPQLADSIRITVNGIAPQYIEKFTFCTHEVGLLFGNVQSGKTGQMFGIISSAADLGFPIFIIMTTDNVVLQQQTIERVRDDLDGFCICDEYDTEIFAKNNLETPTIVVLKKNFRTLKQWTNILASTGFVKGNPVFIIDDEADAASLNTLVNKVKKSSINRYLDEIKAMSASSIYLQVTGTPQALFLQTQLSGWHPYFTYYFRPGNNYLGGDFFFAKDQPRCISYIDSIKEPLMDALLHHLIVSAQILSSGGKVCNFLIHPSVRKSAHTQFENDVIKAIKDLRIDFNSDKVQNKCKELYMNLKPNKTEILSFDILIDKAKKLLDENDMKVLIMNGDSHIDSEEYSYGSNVIIGGNTLGRGVTFSGLQTIYYTRTSKKPQADTMWQHSRMFGYDRDPGLMQVYIDEHLYKLFSDINATNNSIISQVERGIKDVKIYYPEGLNPTRNNVLDTNKLIVLSGGTNYYPFSPDNDSIEEINTLLEVFSEKEPSYQVSLRLIKELLKHISSEDDFKIQSIIGVIETLLAEKPTGQGVLIVRRERNVAKGTGALLSPNDWQIGASIRDKVVLTMYQMTGDKGWNGKKLWVPNIKFPDGIVYYDINDSGE
ncbi:Z1 domain-containing protein [Lacrimispora sp. 38-1]|uniref:Z1 domain-containing protein n=1 Tax=Lacrimispora sp. 38-1 TaxID=3125778 RepID=UPI003CEDF826